MAIRVAWAHEEKDGFVVEDVQAQNRGFDLISRRPHPEDPTTFTEVRFIEVKGRAGVGEVYFSANEYRAAGTTPERLLVVLSVQHLRRFGS